MKKLTIIALTLITLGAASQIVERNIDKEDVKAAFTSTLKENDELDNDAEKASLYFKHEEDKNSSLMEKIGF